MATKFLVKLGKAIASPKPKETDLRMKLKAASDHYTDAIVDLGLAKTIQLSEVVEAGFEMLENQVRRGLVGGLGNAVGMYPNFSMTSSPCCYVLLVMQWF